MNSNNINNTFKQEREKEHEMTLKLRKELSVSGVKNVSGFDEALVELSTVCGVMNIEGEGIQISFLDTDNGRLTLSGNISGIYYIDKKPKKGGLFGNKQK